MHKNMQEWVKMFYFLRSINNTNHAITHSDSLMHKALLATIILSVLLFTVIVVSNRWELKLSSYVPFVFLVMVFLIFHFGKKRSRRYFDKMRSSSEQIEEDAAIASAEIVQLSPEDQQLLQGLCDASENIEQFRQKLDEIMQQKHLQHLIFIKDVAEYIRNKTDAAASHD